MKKYKCTICGHIYDEAVEGVKFEDLPDDWVCPLCMAPKSMFVLIEDTPNDNTEFNKFLDNKKENNSTSIESYLKEYERYNDEFEKNLDDIREMAKTGKSIISAMGTSQKVISWSDILILGCGLNPMPLLESDEVSLKTIIGHRAKKPLVIDTPVYVTHMSYGALSKEAKISLAKGSSMVNTAMCSGEGGILPEERENSYKYIFEIVPNMYSVTDDNLKNSDAIEIKIGQGTKPGMGGHLPKEKVTEDIAKIRGKKVGEDIISPSKFSNIKTKEDLKNFVDELRERSEGRPIGIKIAAGHIEEDLEYIAYANPDFITIDGRGGATAASPKIIKDSTSVPTIYALYRARKYLDEHNLDIELNITGGLRVSSDFAKAIAMGANAIAIGTSAMIAIACQQYRICQTGKCPVGVATQDDDLRSRLKIDISSQRLANFFNATNEELRTFARITSHNDIHDLSVSDLVTTNKEISDYTNIKHV